MNVIWTPRAELAVDRIAEGLAGYSESAATRIIDALTRRTAQLELFPDSGREVPEFRTRLIRKLIEGDYRIIYERFPDRVEIIGVVSGHMSLALEEET